MAAPPFLKKASKRRLDAALPTTSGEKKPTDVATFKNPGNKAGKGLHQTGKGEGINPEKNADTGNFLAMLGAHSNKKSKTKVQPAAARKVAAMKLAKKR